MIILEKRSLISGIFLTLKMGQTLAKINKLSSVNFLISKYTEH